MISKFLNWFGGILKHKKEFIRFIKILIIMGLIAFFLFSFYLSYSEKDGLNCGSKPVKPNWGDIKR